MAKRIAVSADVVVFTCKALEANVTSTNLLRQAVVRALKENGIRAQLRMERWRPVRSRRVISELVAVKVRDSKAVRAIRRAHLSQTRRELLTKLPIAKVNSIYTLLWRVWKEATQGGKARKGGKLSTARRVAMLAASFNALPVAARRQLLKSVKGSRMLLVK